MRPIDLTGQRYGRLLGIERVRDADRHTKWRFQCDCGKETIAHLDAVRAGVTQSCGCFRIERVQERCITHGHSVDYMRTPEIRAWHKAKGRCFNPKDGKYPIYGGRGITMCAEWAADAGTFLRDMGPRPKGTTLERIDVNGNYEPSNCRWATRLEQANNRRMTLFVDLPGRRITMTNYARELGINYRSLWACVKNGEDVHVAAARLAAR